MAVNFVRRGSKGASRDWRRLAGHFGNIGHLLSGNVLSNVLAMGSLAIAARTLSTVEFGTLVMVVTYVRLVERLIRFESWQPLIHFAANLSLDASVKLSRLYLFGLLLDAAAAIFATATAIGFAWFFGPLVAISDSAITLIAIYASGILFNITGVPTASLRMAGRFRSIAYVQPVAQLVRLPLAGLCALFRADLQSFVLAWLAAQIVGSSLFFFLGWRALAAQSIPNPLKSSPRGLMREFPGFASFAWSSNLSMTLRTVTQEADVLLVGLFAGAPSAGFYHVAKRLAKIAQQVGGQTQAVLYPDMARLWAAARFAELRSLTRRLQIILFAIGASAVVAAALVGELLVNAILGHRYSHVGLLLVVQLLAVTFIMHGAPSRSVLLSMGKPSVVLRSSVLGAVVFFSAAALLIPRFGALGAAYSQIGLAAISALWMDIAWARNIGRKIREAADISGDRED